MAAKKAGGAPDAPRARSNSRSESVRAALERKRAGITAGWHPCLWCAGAIAEQRVKDAMLRGAVPKYCSDECRRNEPARSLVHKVFAIALGASPDDEVAWRSVFDRRIEGATLKLAAIEKLSAKKSKGAK